MTENKVIGLSTYRDELIIKILNSYNTTELPMYKAVELHCSKMSMNRRLSIMKEVQEIIVRNLWNEDDDDPYYFP